MAIIDVPIRGLLLTVALLAFAAGAPGSLGAALEGGETVATAPRGAVAGPGVLPALEGRERLPVIVTLRADGIPSPRQLASRRAQIAELRGRALEPTERADVDVTAAWAAAPAFAATVSDEGLADLLSAPEVLRVDVDRVVRPALPQSGQLIRAHDVHAAGVTGKGVTVAVLDTGIDTDHPDLVDDLVAERCFARVGSKGACPDGSSSQSGPGSAEDDGEHGTLVSSIITSRGTVSPRGVAPDAKIVAVKVLSAEDGGSASGIVSALDWLITSRPDVKVVNMSLGGELYRGACDGSLVAYASVLNALRSRGVTVIVASGNDASSNSLSAPACVASALSVGAVYDANAPGVGWSDCADASAVADRVTCFSNGGEGLDLLAPGAMITSGAVGGGSDTWGGTSAAAPHAAGAVALLLEARPELSPDQVEATLETTGKPITDHRNGRVVPRIDVRAAVDAARVLAPPPPPPYLPEATTTFPDPTGDSVGPDVSSVTVTSTRAGLLVFSVVTPNRATLGTGETIWVLLDVDRDAATGNSQGAELALVTGGGVTDLVRWSGSWRTVRNLADGSHAGGVLTITASQDELGTRADFGFAVQAQTATSVADRSPATGAWPFPSLPLQVARAGTGGGTISSGEAGGISCGSICLAAFARGSEVTLTAVPGVGSAFVEWGGACGGVGPCTVAMTDLVSVTARFEALRRLVVAKEGTGAGTVTAGSSIACGEACAATVPNGSALTFAAQPDAGSRFDGWTGACTGPEPCTLAVDADKALTARFTDVAPPEAQAFASSGRRGRTATMRFRLRDNGAGVRVQLTVHAGATTLAILRRGPLAPNGEPESIEWRVPQRFKGRGRFCVRGTDLAGNSGPLRCARLAVR